MISWVIGSGETSRNFRQVLQMTVREKPLSMMRDTRNGFVALVALMVQYLAANETGQTAGARFDPLLQLRASIPEISKCRQLIVVTSEAWNAVSATIQLFERTQGGQTSWQKVGKPFSGVIGSRGFAWGIGLHGTGEAGAPLPFIPPALPMTPTLWTLTPSLSLNLPLRKERDVSRKDSASAAGRRATVPTNATTPEIPQPDLTRAPRPFAPPK